MRGTDVVVVGSLNQDLIVETDRRPAGGETVLGRSLATAQGGKGANQAAAAARAGARVAMVGCVGDDAAGAALLARARARGGGDRDRARARGGGVGHRGDRRRRRGGELDRRRSPARTRGSRPRTWRRALAGAQPRVVLAQLEVPEAAVAAAARGGARLVLNASPVRALPAELLAAADPLIVNAGEAAALAGAAGRPGRLAAALLDRGARSVVVTLGAERRALDDGGRDDRVPGARRSTWSTRPAPATSSRARSPRTLSRGASPEAALAAAVEAGAAAVGWRGAQPG